jgi:hypothetical protein
MEHSPYWKSDISSDGQEIPKDSLPFSQELATVHYPEANYI